jgi:hypothetical protein
MRIDPLEANSHIQIQNNVEYQFLMV